MRVTAQSLVRLDRGGLPSLPTGRQAKPWKADHWREGSRWVVLKGRFKGICALAHRPNVPLQVFSGETTPILGIGFPPITEKV